MKLITAVVAMAMLTTPLLLTGQSAPPKAASRDDSKADRAAIERLHQQDKEATLSDSADQLAKLWDKDAIRFPITRPAEIGAAKIYADDKQWEMSAGRERDLCYDYEIQDVQIAGDWAFEWGYFSGKTSKDNKVSMFYGTGLRLMRKQTDGTWRFAGVMSLAGPSASAVVLKHPCQIAARQDSGGIVGATRFGQSASVISTSAGSASEHPSVEEDMIGIERLHQQDKVATLSDSADQLAKLWDKDAVRFPIGRPAEIGAATIYADDKRWEMSAGRERDLCYDLEVQDVLIAGDWAVEWAYGSLKTSKEGKVAIQYAKLMRVMKRQSDGTWRFARVMGLPAPSASAVVLKHPCQ